MPATVITIVNAHLKLADTEAGLTTGVDYQCQVIEASINATPNLVTVPATYCQAESQSAAATGYELALTWLQDWTAPGGGLSGYAYTNDTEEKWFSLSLEDPDTAPPVAKGPVRVVAGAFGGAAGTPLQTSATWPCSSKPVITLPAIAGMAAESDLAASEEEPEAAVA